MVRDVGLIDAIIEAFAGAAAASPYRPGASSNAPVSSSGVAMTHELALFRLLSR